MHCGKPSLTSETNRLDCHSALLPAFRGDSKNEYRPDLLLGEGESKGQEKEAAL